MTELGTYHMYCNGRDYNGHMFVISKNYEEAKGYLEKLMGSKFMILFPEKENDTKL